MNNIWDTLAEFEYDVFENEESFLKEFCAGQDVMTLLEISFTSSSIKIVYILQCGQHIVNSFNLTRFLLWYNKI